jgi:hypothetical protein
VIVEHAEPASLDVAVHAYDLFVVHAAADADFVRGYLLPARNLPPARVLVLDALPLGGVIARSNLSNSSLTRRSAPTARG